MGAVWSLGFLSCLIWIPEIKVCFFNLKRDFEDINWEGLRLLQHFGEWRDTERVFGNTPKIPVEAMLMDTILYIFGCVNTEFQQIFGQEFYVEWVWRRYKKQDFVKNGWYEKERNLNFRKLSKIALRLNICAFLFVISNIFQILIISRSNWEIFWKFIIFPF